MDKIASQFAQINDRRKDHFSIDEDFIVKIYMGFPKLTLWDISWSLKNTFSYIQIEDGFL